ncbi:signal peptidase I [Candidatus Woesearchaeota archaeon]|nr:signal peptidase I [Candidatus Woesearchaeota archaeon]
MGVIKLISGVMLLLAVFITGIVAAPYFSEYSNKTTPKYQTINFEEPKINGLEHPSPKDRIKEDQIKVYNDRIVIYAKDPLWAKFTDTNSMDPVFDAGSNALQLKPSSETDIEIGDIISYENEYSDSIIIHRIINIGYDETGWYAIAKGDNNSAADPGKIRFNQIKKVLFGIIY